MAETTNTTNTDEQVKEVENFTAAVSKGMEEGLPDYSDEGWKVGGAGLYWQPDNEEAPAVLRDSEGNDKVIEAVIELGENTGKSKILISCEEGITNYVTELADDEDNNLPMSKTGIAIHYICEGIARDFGTTFSEAPTSLGGGTGRARQTKSGRAAGKRVMTKQEKNLIMDRLDMAYYSDDIKAGRMTLEEAFAEIQKAYQKKEYVEGLGYYLSPNRTEGVLLYDWKNIINNTYENIPTITGSALYTYNKIEVVLPNIYSNYYAENRENSNKKLCSELSKSILLGTVMEDMVKYKVKGMGGTLAGNKAGAWKDGDTINSEEDILNLIGHKAKGEVKGIHLAKYKKPGFMKPRYIVVDEYCDGKQTLFLYDKDSSTHTLRS